MFCPNCGKDLGNGARFCNNCGFNLSQRAGKGPDPDANTGELIASVPYSYNE